MEYSIHSDDEMRALGGRVASCIQKGAVLELVGDVGAGKTTFTKGLAKALGVEDAVQSPTFTISQEYQLSDGRTLIHYDFYRLVEAGILSADIVDTTRHNDAIVVIEWAEIVKGVLPTDRLTIEIIVIEEDSREVHIHAGGCGSQTILEGLA